MNSTGNFVATYAEAENLIAIEHDGEDIDLVIINGEVLPSLIAHQDMGDDWKPEFLDQALSAAGWERLDPWFDRETRVRRAPTK